MYSYLLMFCLCRSTPPSFFNYTNQVQPEASHLSLQVNLDLLGHMYCALCVSVSCSWSSLSTCVLFLFTSTVWGRARSCCRAWERLCTSGCSSAARCSAWTPAASPRTSTPCCYLWSVLSTHRSLWRVRFMYQSLHYGANGQNAEQGSQKPVSHVLFGSYYYFWHLIQRFSIFRFQTTAEIIWV